MGSPLGQASKRSPAIRVFWVHALGPVQGQCPHGLAESEGQRAGSSWGLGGPQRGQMSSQQGRRSHLAGRLGHSTETPERQHLSAREGWRRAFPEDLTKFRANTSKGKVLQDQLHDVKENEMIQAVSNVANVMSNT